MPSYVSPFRLPDWQLQLIDQMLGRGEAPSFGEGLSPLEQSLSTAANVRDMYSQALSDQARSDQEIFQYREDERLNRQKEEEFARATSAADIQHQMDLETEGFKAATKPTKASTPMGEVETPKTVDEIKSMLNELIGAKPTATDSGYTNTITNRKGQVYDPTTGGFGTAPSTKQKSSVSEKARQNLEKSMGARTTTPPKSKPFVAGEGLDPTSPLSKFIEHVLSSFKSGDEMTPEEQAFFNKWFK